MKNLELCEIAGPKRLPIILFSLCVFLVPPAIEPAHAQQTPRGSRHKPDWDTYSDTWSATDALGRSLPLHDQAGPPRPDRWVGIFYFLWHGAHTQGGPYDISRILSADPDAINDGQNSLWGPLHNIQHLWAEPLFGYYLNDDKWVLRKHAQMLADAGVDVLIFDVTNKKTYKDYYTILFDVLSQMRQERNRTPHVAFMTPFLQPAGTVRQLYDDLYSKGLYRDLWFYWENKPLILADPKRVNPELLDFFTFRTPQPGMFHGPIPVTIPRPDMSTAPAVTISF